MARVKSPTRRRHKKILKAAKGFRQARRVRYRAAREAVLHAGQYAYVGRKDRKGDFRRLWIERINAAVRPEGLSYSTFMDKLKRSKIGLNRKILAQLALEDPEVFIKIVEKAKATR